MRPESGDAAFLWDMREQALAISAFLHDVDRATFLAEENLRLIAERRIEIIGEAASHVSPQFRSAHPEVPWRRIIGQRNILIHDYGQIIPERVWESASRDVPELVRILDDLLGSIDQALAE